MTSVLVVVAVQLWGPFLGQAMLYAASAVPLVMTTGQPATCRPGTRLVPPQPVSLSVSVM